MSMC